MPAADAAAHRDDDFQILAHVWLTQPRRKPPVAEGLALVLRRTRGCLAWPSVGHRLSCELSLRTEISGSVLRMLKDVDLTAEVVLRSQEATEEGVGAVSFQEGSFVNCRAYD